MGNMWNFTSILFNDVFSVCNKIWALLTTTLNDAIDGASTGITWLDGIINPLLSIVGDWNLLNLFLTATIVIIVIRIVRTFLGG